MARRTRGRAEPAATSTGAGTGSSHGNEWRARASCHVAGDPQLAQSREADGEPGDQDEADGISTTGTAESQEFVGRAAGDDVGYAGETGAEARAEAGG